MPAHLDLSPRSSAEGSAASPPSPPKQFFPLTRELKGFVSKIFSLPTTDTAKPTSLPSTASKRLVSRGVIGHLQYVSGTLDGEQHDHESMEGGRKGSLRWGDLPQLDQLTEEVHSGTDSKGEEALAAIP